MDKQAGISVPLRKRGVAARPRLILFLALGFIVGPYLRGPLLAGAAEVSELKTDTALYHLEPGTLQYAFTFVNPTDSVVFLDCQVPPFATLSGNTLLLSFDRTAFPAGGGSNSAAGGESGIGSGGVPPASGGVPPASGGVPPASGGVPPASGDGGHGVSSTGKGRPPGPAVLAGGPLDGRAVNPDDFPPQRVGPQQTFQGQRKLDRVLGDPHARPAFAKVQLRMAFYPERAQGEGTPYRVEGKTVVSATAKPVVRKGKAGPPPKVKTFRVPRTTPLK